MTTGAGTGEMVNNITGQVVVTFYGSKDKSQEMMPLTSDLTDLFSPGWTDSFTVRVDNGYSYSHLYTYMYITILVTITRITIKKVPF